MLNALRSKSRCKLFKMSFFIASCFVNVHSKWKLLFEASIFGLCLYHRGSNNHIQVCHSRGAYIFIELNSLNHFDCNSIEKSDGNSLKDEISRFFLFNNSMVEIYSGGTYDTKWTLGLVHDSQSIYLSDDFLFSVGDSSVSESAFYIHHDSFVTLDSTLFSVPSEWTKALDVDDQEVKMCEILSLQLNLQNALSPFMLISDSSWTRFTNTDLELAGQFPWSLSHWLQFCGLAPTTVHSWELLPLSWDDPYQLNNDGICGVKYVLNGRHSDASSRRSVVCLSDVMDEEYRVLKGNWNETEKMIPFLSSLGLPFVKVNSHSDKTSLQQSITYYLELMSVIRSYLALDQSSSSLYVQSLAKPFNGDDSRCKAIEVQFEAAGDSSVAAVLIDLLLIYEEDENSRSWWKTQVNRLQSLRKDLTEKNLDVSCLDFDHSFLRAILAVFINEKGDVNNLCSTERLYFCIHDEERLQLAGLIKDATIQNFVSEVFNRQRSDWQAVSSRVAVDRSDEIVRPSVHTLTDGDLFILIYVLPEHMSAADSIVATLQAGAVYDDYIQRTAHIYIRYLIVPISVSNDDGVSCSLSESGECDVNISRQSVPSMRAVLEHARQFITDVLDIQDILFVLVGLEALRAFPQPAAYPGTKHNNPKEFTSPYKGIVPNCPYGGNSIYRLSANIMVSCSTCDENHASNSIGRVMLNMIDEVQRHPLYPFTSDSMVRSILQEYASLHPLEVALDRDNIAFDFQQENLATFQSSKISSLDDTIFADFEALFYAYYHNSSTEDVVNTILLDKLADVSSSGLLVTETDQNGRCVIAMERMNIELPKSFNDCLMNHKWFAGVFNLIVFAEIGKHCDNYLMYVDDLAYRFFQLSRYAKFWSYYISHDEYRYSAQLLQFYLKSVIQNAALDCTEGSRTVCMNVFGSAIPCQCSSEYLSAMDRLEVAVSTAQAALYQETGSYDESIRAFRTSLNPESYSVIQQRRSEWKTQRLALQQKYSKGNVISDDVKIHFATYSSKSSTELDALVLSAKMSLIDLQILGLGTEFTDYSQKINGYFHYLHTLDEDDIVVLVDAFDVLLLPRARQIGHVMAHSETPIMFCAEAGIYPEFTGAFMYHRGSINSHRNEYTLQDHMTQKFLNSGCMAGRAGQLKHMFSFAHMLSYVFRDDQQVLIHYMLQNPDMIGIDTQREMFLTTFKMISVVTDAGSWSISELLSLTQQPRQIDGALESRGVSSVGVIHCNNKANAMFYNVFVQQLNEYNRLYYSGEDGPYLLQAVNALHDNQVGLALEYLTSDVVTRNLTSKGGSNGLGDGILSLLTKN